MIFTTQENQKKIVSLMEAVDDMHRSYDMALTAADRVELTAARMIQHLLNNHRDCIVMSYDLAHKLIRLNVLTSNQMCVRLIPFNKVVTRARLTGIQTRVFSVMNPDGSTITYNDFDTFLEGERLADRTKYSYIVHAFSKSVCWLNTYRRAQSWSKNIIQNSHWGYYGDQDFIYNKLDPAAEEFIENADTNVSFNDVLKFLEQLN